jgi:(E)-4-hydroxy-3-methylbut-2-enyl-diphosphate synthase
MSPSGFIYRFPAREIKIGDCSLGGKNPIRLQSMTNTNTLDVKATAVQSIRIIEAGADYVRISAPSLEAAHKLKEIKTEIRKAGFTTPIVADIHFNPEVALVAATLVEKIRINPGNYTRGLSRNKTTFTEEETRQHLELTAQRLKPLVKVCREYGTAIRIGTNMGSISPRIIARYGNTPIAMVQSTLEFLRIFREMNFHNLVISLKASKPLLMIQAYEEMVEKMIENNMDYPLHIGITEAGEGENGRIKSALGICTLLNKGIGDTLRVSLTEDPELEIPFAKIIADNFQNAFTAREATQSFKLKKTVIADKKISIFNDHKYAVVIENLPEKLPGPADSEGGINYHPDSTQTSQELTRTADLYFTRVPDEKNHFKDHKYIIPATNWVKNHAPNTFPIFNYDEWKKINYTLNTGFFLNFSPLVNPEYIPLTGINKPLAMVADMNKPAHHTELVKLILTCKTINLPVIVRMSFSESDPDSFIVSFAEQLGPLLLEQKIQGLWIDAPALNQSVTELIFGFLQSSGLRITATEFISCPTCARTSFDLQKVLHEIQKKTSHLPGLKIAVMGCVVNGPGEMADADFGYVGAGNGKIHLYQGKTPVRRNMDPDEAVGALLEILMVNGYL